MQACDLRLLRRGRRGDRPVHLDPVAAGLDLGDDLRHLPFLVHRLQGQPGGDRGHAVQGGDLVRLRLRERELRPRQEEVVHEVRAGLAELGEIGDHGLVRLDDVATATAAERPAPCPPGPCGSPSGRCRFRRAGRASRSAPRRAPSRGSRSRSRGRRRPRGRAASGSCGRGGAGVRRGDTGGRTRTHRNTAVLRAS